MTELRFTFTVGVALYLLLNYWNRSGGVEAVSFIEDVTITPQQKTAIEKLRYRVSPYIVEDYMKEDIYLVKWLRVTDFDISKAEKKLIENIRWRKEKRLANIEDENFDDVSLDYPYLKLISRAHSISEWVQKLGWDGFDKEGRPVFIAFAGEWNIRQATVTGRIRRVLRYLDQGLEMLARQIRSLQKSGNNVTQAVLIIDLNQFSIMTHACVQCLFRVLDFLNSYENHFPGMADKVFFVNAPPSVQFALEFIRQNISKETRAALEVYGTNRQQWQSVLQNKIERKYLPTELGGTLERN